MTNHCSIAEKTSNVRTSERQKRARTVETAKAVRWNSGFFSLKTKGYNLEHNFGHGKQHLASLLATLNILSLLFYTLLELLEKKYKLLRSHLPTCKTLFDDLRALTRYLDFDS